MLVCISPALRGGALRFCSQIYWYRQGFFANLPMSRWGNRRYRSTPPSSFSSSSDTPRYRLQPHSFSTMYFSLAVTSISADLPSGNVPTTRVRRRVSLFSCSMALFVPILVQCCMGKSVCASWRARRSGMPCSAPPSCRAS